MATQYIDYEPLVEDQNSLPEENGGHEQDGGLNSAPDTCILIINNAEESLSRKRDAEWQQLLFLTLGFDVRVYRDQTADEIIQLVDSVKAEGSFILSILSPGDQTSIHCNAGRNILLSDLESSVSKTSQDPMVPKVAIFDIYQANGSAAASNYKRIANMENTLTVTSVTSGNDSQLTKVLYEEISRSNKDQSLSQITENTKRKFQDQHQQQVDINDTLQHPYYIKRGTSWLSLDQIKTKFREAAKKWIPLRDKTLQQLDETIGKLIEHRKNVNIARITGSAVSIGGAVVAVIGFGLAPVTFGASLGLSVGGIVVATAGGATAAGASIADMAIQKSNVKETQEKLNEDQETLKPIVQLAGEMRQIVDEIQKKCPGIDNKTTTMFFTGIIAHSVVRGGNVGMRAAELALIGVLELGALALRVGGTAARAVAAVGIVFNVLLIPIDVAEIVRSGINMGKGNKSDAVIKLQKLRKDLEEQKITIHKIAYPENYQD